MKTFIAKPQNVEHNWLLLDAEGLTLGRMAAEIASRLRGKHKPEYTPHVDTGDYIVVINAEKVAVTGKKRTQKLYRRHSGRPGGMKTETFAKLQQRLPERILEHAIKGMLPKNSLGKQLFTKLKVYAGPAHPHEAQQPKEITISTIPGEN